VQCNCPGTAPTRSFRDVWLISIGHSLTHWYPATFYLLLPLIDANSACPTARSGSS